MDQRNWDFNWMIWLCVTAILVTAAYALGKWRGRVKTQSDAWCHGLGEWIGDTSAISTRHHGRPVWKWQCQRCNQTANQPGTVYPNHQPNPGE